ncbi:hypothetical protein BVRB_001680 [Beta vulgaris subsp. vulgaris]|uniref:Uncharacterized protein n=1 Tax=Beta vulgaris subsp. vulgaris TaxID=3555 RepID=A0A0J8B8J5_BETVV|nr:hypothetical protein BVRB_001680 [Beta vulgaris subsp. vulgaris]
MWFQYEMLATDPPMAWSQKIIYQSNNKHMIWLLRSHKTRSFHRKVIMTTLVALVTRCGELEMMHCGTIRFLLSNLLSSRFNSM